METCVLIPQEFALAVTGVGARHSPEQTATVWSSVAIPQGRLCYPFQGTVRIDNLAIFSALPEDDVSSSRHATPASVHVQNRMYRILFTTTKPTSTEFVLHFLRSTSVTLCCTLLAEEVFFFSIFFGVVENLPPLYTGSYGAF
uniref:Uncharacterized protein n=1 Tax=Anopheles merus TaxID=30066 RepID=A0A182VIK0_ANOME